VAARLAGKSDVRLPPVSVIVPLAGEVASLRENLESLASLDYPVYELILVARSGADLPAKAVPSASKVVFAGENEAGIEERAWSLLVGLATARRVSQVYAFTDGRGRVATGWLRALVAPLEEGAVGASTGYRWYAPVPPAFWSLMRSVWNAALVERMVEAPWAWSGATAITRTTFDELRLAERFAEAGAGETTLTAAVRAGRRPVVFAPGAMVASTAGVGAREFLLEAVDEMARHRSLGGGRRALWFHLLQCGAMAAAIGASLAGSRLAEWVLVIQFGLIMLKGANRALLARAMLPAEAAWFKRHAWVHALWAPLALWVWLLVLVPTGAALQSQHEDRVGGEAQA